MTKISAPELRSIMAQCTGTEAYHKLSISPIKCTDGVKVLADAAGAYWLVDAIGSYQGTPKIKDLGIQFWFLEVKDSKAVLYCIEDSGKPHLIEQKIEYTDFPEGEWKFYVQGDVMMLPQEY
jgi:hypothetical protein